MSASEFNDLVAPFSDSSDTARLLQRDETAKQMQLSYTPQKSKGIYHNEQGSFINTHMAADIKPLQGDTTPWLQFMERLCPDQKDRKELLRWCATLIARPDIRMHYGVLAISETQGVGKGTLGEKILAPLVGRDNVSFPAESEIVDSQYNYWISHKRLAIVHEIYAGNSSKPYNRLKSAITDQRITVSRKYMANYEIENWIHIYACSNSTRALKLSADDRRWFVPRIVEERSTTQYWQQFNIWLELEGGLGIIKQWAADWLQHNDPVRTGDTAPDSSLKRAVIEENLSPGQELVLRTLIRISEQLANEPQTRQSWEQQKFLVNDNVMITDRLLVELIKQVIHEGRHSVHLERMHTVRKLAKLAGWSVGEQAARVSEWGMANYNARIICSSGEFARVPPNELYREHRILPLPIDILRGPM
jgi:hypothetical protein